MRAKIIPPALLLGTLLVAMLTQAVPVKITMPPETAKLKETAGADLAKAQCLLCHSADYISTQPRLSAAAWKATVIKMRDKYGASIAEDKIEPLVQYLATNYGLTAIKK